MVVEVRLNKNEKDLFTLKCNDTKISIQEFIEESKKIEGIEIGSKNEILVFLDVLATYKDDPNFIKEIKEKIKLSDMIQYYLIFPFYYSFKKITKPEYQSIVYSMFSITSTSCIVYDYIIKSNFVEMIESVGFSQFFDTILDCNFDEYKVKAGLYVLKNLNSKDSFRLTSYTGSMRLFIINTILNNINKIDKKYIIEMYDILLNKYGLYNDVLFEFINSISYMLDLSKIDKELYYLSNPNMVFDTENVVDPLDKLNDLSQKDINSIKMMSLFKNNLKELLILPQIVNKEEFPNINRLVAKKFINSIFLTGFTLSTKQYLNIDNRIILNKDKFESFMKELVNTIDEIFNRECTLLVKGLQNFLISSHYLCTTVCKYVLEYSKNKELKKYLINNKL